MQPIEIRSLGFKLSKSVPDSVEEFDKLAHEVGAALREANRNVLYRSTLASFRNSYLHGAEEEKEGDTVVVPAIVGLDKQFGIERKTKITKEEKREPSTTDAEGNVVPGKIIQEQVEAWDETEDEFFSRIVATIAGREGKSVEAVQDELLAGAQAVLDAIPFDPSKSERKSAGPKKTPAGMVAIAEEIVKATGSVDNAIAAFQRKTGTTVNPATLEGLAAAVWADQKAQKKKIADGYAAA